MEKLMKELKEFGMSDEKFAEWSVSENVKKIWNEKQLEELKGLWSGTIFEDMASKTVDQAEVVIKNQISAIESVEKAFKEAISPEVKKNNKKK